VYDESILHHLNVSVLLPSTAKFSSLLNLAYTACSTEFAGPWRDETTDVGLTLDKTTANELELFVCGSNDPTSAQSDILLRSILLCGVNESCICDYDEQLLVLCQIQDPVIVGRYIIEGQTLLTNAGDQSGVVKVTLMNFVGGAFVNSFPDMRETAKSSDAVITEFEAACQTGVSALASINVHAKLEVEARFVSSTVLRNMHGRNSELQGFDSSLSAVVTNEEITAPPPVYI